MVSGEGVSAATTDAVIRRRCADLNFKAEMESLLVKVVLLFVFGWVLLTQVLVVDQANGMDMFPAIEDGDVVIGYRLESELWQDDVVVYRVDGKRHIGRVVARETDVVVMDDSGTLQVNGTTQEGEIAYPTYAEEGGNYPLTVPEGHVFVLGDYRTHADDSRVFGCIPVEDVEGKAIGIFRRRDI